MSAIVKMNAARLGKYIQFEDEHSLLVSYATNHINVSADVTDFGYLEGDAKVKNRKEGKYKAGDTLVIEFGNVRPQRYDLFIQPYTGLYCVAFVSCPTILPANTTTPLVMRIKFMQDKDVLDCPYLFSAYLID